MTLQFELYIYNCTAFHTWLSACMQRSHKRATEPAGKPKPNLLTCSRNFTKGKRKSRLLPGCSAPHSTCLMIARTIPKAQRQAIMLPSLVTCLLSSPSGSCCVLPVLLLETHTKVEHGTPAKTRAPTRHRRIYCKKTRNPVLGCSM